MNMKKYLSIILAVVAVATSCQKEDVFAPWRDPSKYVIQTEVSPYFTVMHYNIFGAQGGWTSARFDDVAAVILSQKPDFVSLNEVDSMTTRNKYHMAKEIGNRVGMHYYYAVAREPYSHNWNQAGAYGDAMLSRYPVREVKRFKLYPDPAQGDTDKEDRSVCAIKAVVGEQMVWILTTHLDHRGNEMSRVYQAKNFKAIVQELERDCDVIICGDMNAHPTSNPMKIMYEYLTPCFPGYNADVSKIVVDKKYLTYPSLMNEPQPRNLIDYIALGNGKSNLTCMSYRVVNDDASDHCPVIATFKFKN